MINLTLALSCRLFQLCLTASFLILRCVRAQNLSPETLSYIVRIIVAAQCLGSQGVAHGTLEGSPKTLPGSLQSQNCFHKNMKTLLFSFTMLPFALWWKTGVKKPVRDHHAPTGMAGPVAASVCQWRWGVPRTDGGCELLQLLWETFWRFLTQLHIDLPCHSPEGTQFHKRTCTCKEL